MTHVSDSFFSGVAPTLIVSDPAGVNNGGRGFGPIGRTYVYDIVPLALNAAAYAASQSPGAGSIVLTAGTGVTAVNANGVIRYTADVPRAVRIVSGGNDSAIVFTVSGFDTYGKAMTENITGANAGTATGKKAFMSIVSVAHTGTVAGTLTIGTTDVFGLPAATIDAGYITNVKWNNTLAANAGTFVVADVTTPATATTGDVRGTYLQAGAASNGTIRLVITLSLSAIQSGSTQTLNGVLGVPQF